MILYIELPKRISKKRLGMLNEKLVQARAYQDKYSNMLLMEVAREDMLTLNCVLYVLTVLFGTFTAHVIRNCVPFAVFHYDSEKLIQTGDNENDRTYLLKEGKIIHEGRQHGIDIVYNENTMLYEVRYGNKETHFIDKEDALLFIKKLYEQE